MHKLVLAICLCLTVSACAILDSERGRDALRAELKNQVILFNDAGYDPIRLPPEKLLFLHSLCSVGSLVGAYHWVDDPEMSDEIAETCALIIAAAAPAP